MRLLPVLLTAAVVAGAPGLAAWPQPVNPHALALKGFRDRVDQYVRLRNRVRAGMPKLAETSDPAEITNRERALGEAVRAARAGASRGEIFSPDVVPFFRETIGANFRQRPPKERQAALASVPDEPLKVNDAYPATVPLATVPPTLLAQLPPLPETVEYRLVGDRLILRDIDANLVVDFVPNAVPKPGA
ncbi:MAG: hypothetical protein H6Q10_2464 [Acidobacteria bacterium]|nr:hypothetical protein [Acidobacteriota bacterium]